jgi:hypothetical protein
VEKESQPGDRQWEYKSQCDSIVRKALLNKHIRIVRNAIVTTASCGSKLNHNQTRTYF